MAVVSGPASSVLNIAVTLFGRATYGTNATLQDSSKTWPANYWSGVLVKVTIRNADYLSLIASNTADTLTFANLPNNLVVSPGDPYAIMGSGVGGGLSTFAFDSGTAAAGTNTTLQDTAKSWPVNLWVGATVKVSIAGVEYFTPVASNTIDTLTFAALPGGITVGVGNKYAIIGGALAGMWIGQPAVTILNAAAIRAAATINSDVLVDYRDGKRLFIKVESTLDQNCSIQLVGNHLNNFVNAVNLNISPKICLAASNIGFGLAWDDWIPYVGCTITTLVAPAAGVLNIYAIVQK